MDAGVVLIGERAAVLHREVAALAVQPPGDATGCDVDLVDRVGVPGRDDKVAVGVLFDRVEVDVVPRLFGDRRRAAERLVEGYVVERVPLEHDPAGGDVDLLDDSIEGPAFRLAADSGQVPDNGVVDNRQDRAVGGQLAFVLVDTGIPV